jgi:hypothetical protein
VRGLTVQDALTPNIIAIGKEMHPRDVTLDPRSEIFAVFSEMPSSLTTLHSPFLIHSRSNVRSRSRMSGRGFNTSMKTQWLYSDLCNNSLES